MPVTVAGIESELVARLGQYLLRFSMDGTTVDGTNVALRGPIRWAVSRLRIETADAIDVADGDLTTLTRATYETFLDLAEYKVLNVLWGNWAEVTQSLGSESQSLSDLSDRLDRRIAVLKGELGTLIKDPAAGATPGPSAVATMRAGRCDPNRAHRDFYAPGWYGGRYCP
jgi:hypothetical protein